MRKLLFNCRVLSFRSFSSLKLNEHATIQNIFTPQSKTECMKRLEKSASLRPPDLVTITDEKSYAVLIPMLTINGKPSLLFTLRSNSLNNHRGEVSFPGGRIEPGETATDAAIREAHEELGLEPDMVQVWGPMQPSLAKNLKNLVHPVLAKLDDSITPLDLLPHDDEVEHVFTSTLGNLCSPDNVHYTRFRLDSAQSERLGMTVKISGYCLPVFLGARYRIWGLTGVILHQTLKIIVPDLYDNSLDFVKYSK